MTILIKAYNFVKRKTILFDITGSSNENYPFCADGVGRGSFLLRKYYIPPNHARTLTQKLQLIVESETLQQRRPGAK
jgi:hypothetical protein